VKGKLRKLFKLSNEVIEIFYLQENGLKESITNEEDFQNYVIKASETEGKILRMEIRVSKEDELKIVSNQEESNILDRPIVKKKT